MKKIFIPTFIPVFIPVALSLFITAAHATDCARQDIEFYLEKGFTPQQISNMCAQKKPAEVKSQATDSATINAPLPSATATSSDSIVTPADNTARAQQIATIIDNMQQALEVEQLVIEGENLKFVQQLKIKYGKEDALGFLPTIKPQFAVAVNLAGLRVIKTNSHITLLRDASVLLSSDVSIELLEREKYKKAQLAGIDAYLASVGKNAVKIIANKDADLMLLSADINQLGKMHRNQNSQ